MLSSPRETVFKVYVEKVYREKALFEILIPKRFVKLEELIKMGRPYVELLSGDKHYFNINELKNLYELLPWYLRSFTVLPWVFTYKRQGFSGVYELLNNDSWTPRILGYLLYNDISRKLVRITCSEFGKLLSMFKTLIIVVLRIDLRTG